MNDPASPQSLMTGQDLLALPQPPADHTIAYGLEPSQKAELRLPLGPGPHPVVVLVHGGCWQAEWSFDHVRSLAAALAALGYATWSLEYRRIGNPGGGWPGTLEDVARGADHLREVATAYRLDLDRVVALGHSAGGHLALWLAARHRLLEPPPFGLKTPGGEGPSLGGDSPLRLRGVVSLGGITDLRKAALDQVCDDAIPQLIGGTPAEHDDRVRQSSPIELLPLGVPQRLVCGALDLIVPLEQARSYEAAARGKGDDVEVEVVPGAGHFELVNPKSPAWPAVRGAIGGLLSPSSDYS